MRPGKRETITVGVRYVLSVGFIWGLILPETGVWTCIFATLITAEIEYQHGRRMGWWR